MNEGYEYIKIQLDTSVHKKTAHFKTACKLNTAAAPVPAVRTGLEAAAATALLHVDRLLLLRIVLMLLLRRAVVRISALASGVVA